MGRLNYDYNIPLHIVNLNCTGDEESVWNCPSSTQGQSYCTVYNDVSVACHSKASIDYIYIVCLYIGYTVEHSDCDNGQLRFSNGSSTMQGRVELCYNHVWFGICADNNYYDYYFAGTVCNTMGYAQSK